jgi:hypothetical protein
MNFKAWIIQVPVAHICNPRYSGGRDQEDHSLKPVQANSFKPYLNFKNTHHKNRLVKCHKVKALSSNPNARKKNHKKRAGRVAQGIGPEFKPQYGGWGKEEEKKKHFLLMYIVAGHKPSTEKAEAGE